MSIKQLAFVAGALLIGGAAQAETLPVEFQWCSENDHYMCALVYGRYNAEEMVVTSSPEDQVQIEKLLGKRYRTFAMNIEGRVLTVKEMNGGKHHHLYVDSLEADPSAPRPR